MKASPSPSSRRARWPPNSVSIWASSEAALPLRSSPALASFCQASSWSSDSAGPTPASVDCRGFRRCSTVSEPP